MGLSERSDQRMACAADSSLSSIGRHIFAVELFVLICIVRSFLHRFSCCLHPSPSPHILYVSGGRAMTPFTPFRHLVELDECARALNLTHAHVANLELAFAENPRPNIATRDAISDQLHIAPRVVQVCSYSLSSCSAEVL